MYLVLFLSVLIGLGLARTGPGPNGGVCIIVALSVVLVVRQQRLLAIGLIALLGMMAGWWRGDIFMDRLAAFEPLYDQKITMLVRAREDAVHDHRTKQLTFEAGNLVLMNGQRLIGKIQVSGHGANMVFQGDELIVSGKLRPGFGAQQGRMSFAQLETVAHHPTLLSEIRRRFVAGAQSVLPEPLAPFVMGLLVGQRDTLPQATKDDLQKVGLTHIIAVSGANLTIILQASQRLLGRRSKRMSTFLTVGLVLVFLTLAGGSASIVRAAMVSMLSMLVGYYGRNWQPLNLILLAAAMTAWANPVYIWSDLSWYLSFLAFYGILIVSPLLQSRLPTKVHSSVLGGVALETICAEITTLPFVLYMFGEMSHVSLFANILVVSFIPIAMLLGAIAGLVGMFAGTVAGWFTWPAVLVLNYMLDVAHILASVPHAFTEGIGLSLVQMLIVYGCVCFVTAIMWYKSANKSAIITDMDITKRRGLLA